MASNKEPSIFDDRGTIGSSDELDEYGVWVKTEPQDLASDGADMSDIFSENSADYSLDDEEFSADDMDFAIPDMEDLPDLDTLGVAASAPFADEAAAEDEEIGEKMYEDSLEIPDLESDSNEEDGGYAEVSMEDFIETVDDEDTIGAASAAPPDLSTQLLMRIADELSSIRNELSSLKKQFSGLKMEVPQPEDAESGFFGDEDDEKISLTGDELNNIINTAEFSEETGADVGLELSDDEDIQEAFDSSPEEDDTLQLSTADLDTEIDLGGDSFENPEEEINPEDTFAIDHSLDEIPIDLDLSDVSVDELATDELSVEEPIPDLEETGFLAEDPLTNNDFNIEDFADLSEDTSADVSEDSIDFSGLTEEHDLSLEIDDTPIDDISIEEPLSEDITISLDPSELSSEELASEELISEELGAEELISEEPSPDEISVPVFDESSDMDIPLEDAEIPLTDLSLIPEGFGIDEIEPGSVELSSDDLTSAELDSSELDSIELDSAELSSEELDSLELASVEFDSDELSADEFPSEELSTDDFLNAPIEIEETAPEIEEPADAFSGIEEVSEIPSHLKEELKSVLSYMDQLLEALPEEKIEEFARSEYYETYKKLFKDLGLV